MGKYQSKFELLINASAGGAKRVLANLQNDLTKTGKQGKSASATIESGWVSAGMAIAGVTAAAYGLKRAMDFAAEGEKIRNVGIAFEQLNDNATATLATLDTAFKGTLDVTSMQQFANQLKLMGLEAEQMGVLSDTAFKVAAAQGKNAADVMKTLASAIGTGRLQTAAQFGIVVTAKGAQEDYARQLGVSVDALDETAKRQALVNALLAEAELKFGAIDTSKFVVQMQQAQKQLADFQSDLNEGFASIANFGVRSIDRAAAQAANLAWSLRHPVMALREVTHVMPFASAETIELAKSQSESAKASQEAADRHRALAESLRSVRAAMQLATPKVLSTSESLAELHKNFQSVETVSRLTVDQLVRQRRSLEMLRPSIAKAIQDIGTETQAGKELSAEYTKQIKLLDGFIDMRREVAAASDAQTKAQKLLTDAVGKYINLDLPSNLQQSVDGFRKGTISAAQMFAVFKAGTEASGVNGFFADALAGIRTFSLALDEAERRAKNKPSVSGAASKSVDAEIDALRQLRIGASAEQELLIRQEQERVMLSRENLKADKRIIEERMLARRHEAEQLAFVDSQSLEAAKVALAKDLELARQRQSAERAMAEQKRQRRAEEAQALALMNQQFRDNSTAINAQIEAARSSFDALAASGVDAAGRLGMAMNEARTIADAFNQSIVFGFDSAKKAMPGAIAASGRVAGAIIKNDRATAAVKGAFEAAASIASFAVGDFVGGAQHALASTLFFSVAGKGSGKSGGSASGAANGSQATGINQPAQLQAPTGTSSTTTVINLNGFLGTKQEMGMKITEAQNSIAGLGTTIDRRLIGNQHQGF